MSKPSPLKVFITYSHRNRSEKDELKTSLSIMERNKEITVWHDNEMLGGDKWREKITNKLNESDMLLYLTSADSLASENCNAELTQALQEAKTRVIPIILKDCDWKAAAHLSGFQAFPDEGKPINRWRPREAGLQNVVDGIRKTVKEMQEAKGKPPAGQYRSWMRPSPAMKKVREATRATEQRTGEFSHPPLFNMSEPSPLKVFITYSHKNQVERDKLRTFLSVMEQNGEMERNGEMKIWQDNEMLPGDKWSETISKKLAESDILLYLISGHSLASENCNKELLAALQKDKKVIPIILENCDWKSHELSNFEVLPNKGKAINEWALESDGWQNVVAGIRETVRAMQKAKTKPPANEQEKITKLALSLFQHANFLYMLGQFNQTIKAYSEVIEVIPDYADAYNNRGLAYAKRGKYDLAIADFDKAIGLKPDYAEAYGNRGTAYAGRRYYDLAIADYSKAIELKPDDAEVYNNRGNAYADGRNYDLAIADYTKAIKLRPYYAETYNNRGTAYRGKGEYGSAIADYTRAIEINPDLAEAYYNRGCVHLFLSLRIWENAKKDLQAAKAKGVDIVARFRDERGGVERFEQATGITLPPDIKALLTKP